MAHPGLPLALATLFLIAAAPSSAADEAALDLQAEPEVQATAPSPTKLFIEGAVGHAERRYGMGGHNTARLSADLRTSLRPSASTRAAISARVDALDPHDPRIDEAVLSLREAFAGWQDEAATTVLEFGRINIRQGSGYGYNPSDFFRDNALRTITTVDPFQLRENRLGSVMARAQRQWGGMSLAAVYAPKLANARSTHGASLDLGSTNARDRGMLTLSNRWSETLDTQFSLYKEAGTPLRIGASGTALASSALVAHAEWARSRESDLLARASGQSGTRQTRQRLVAGLTYSTATRLSITAEYERNGFALDRDGWRSLVQAGPQTWSAYYLQALALQDLSARSAWLLYATQRDLGLKNLDLTLILRRNTTDRSRMSWIDLRYRLDTMDFTLQYQRNSGVLGAEFGSAVDRQLVTFVTTFYF